MPNKTYCIIPSSLFIYSSCHIPINLLKTYKGERNTYAGVPYPVFTDNVGTTTPCYMWILGFAVLAHSRANCWDTNTNPCQRTHLKATRYSVLFVAIKHLVFLLHRNEITIPSLPLNLPESHRSKDLDSIESALIVVTEWAIQHHSAILQNVKKLMILCIVWNDL